jgi:cyanophycinase
MPFARGVAVAPLLLALLVTGLAAPAEARILRYLTGNPADVQPPLFGPAHDLGGGGTDVDAALQWLVDEVRGCTSCDAKVDVVVLRSSGANGYNDYLQALAGVDSVETLVITRAREADTLEVEATVRGAEVVFFAGGDQCNYVEVFKDTRVETAVESVYARGGAVGGTSAGLAIQGEYVFDACSGTVTSEEALDNPYHRRMSFTYDFFAWTNLDRLITDSHFVARDRMGRVLAFLARQVQDGQVAAAWALAVNERTSVVVDRDGRATVMGDGPAYLILADHVPEVCRPRTPLTYLNFKVWKLPAQSTFDLRNRPSTGYTLRSVVDGLLTGEGY